MSIGHQSQTTARRTATSARLGVVAATAVAGTLLVAPATVHADPGSDGPTIAEVQERIDQINRRGEIAAEQLNTVREQTKISQRRLASLRKDVGRAEARVEHLRTSVVESAVSEYNTTSDLSTSTLFLNSPDPSSFVDSLAADDMSDDQSSNRLTTLLLEQRRLDMREREANQELRLIEKQKRRAAQLTNTLAEREEAAQSVLAELEEERRQRLLAIQRREAREAAREARLAAEQATADQAAATRTDEADTSTSTTSTTPTSTGSGSGSTAVQTALAQVGDAYVWAAVGPDSFDCSGLMMYAWSSAGVSLPHSSGMQASMGTPVYSTSDLQPGDLVFYYSPISHVGMYIGNGQLVHAANPSTGVSVTTVDSMPISAMRRVG